MKRRAVRPPIIFHAFLFILLSQILLACSSKDEEGVPVELTKTPEEIGDRGELELFENAKDFYENGLFGLARERFIALRDSFPLGPYAEFARIKIGDCSFATAEYEEAAIAYENALEEHPGSAAAPYLLLRAARSHQKQNRGAGRDFDTLEKAVRRYDRLLEDYPDSPYARRAAAYRHDALTTLAEHQRLILAFYRKQGKEKAAKAREEEFAKKWKSYLEKEYTGPDSSSDEGSAAQQRASVSLEDLSSASSKEPHESTEGDDIDKSAFLETLQDSTGEASNSESELMTEDKQQVSSGYFNADAPSSEQFIRKVECRRVDQKKEEMVVLHLREVPENFEPALLEAEDGKLTVPLRLSGIGEASFPCFEGRDVVINNEGDLLFPAQTRARVFSLSHPERIILLLETGR